MLLQLILISSLAYTLCLDRPISEVKFNIDHHENLDRYQMGCAQGEYLNLCGECVNVESKTEEVEGTDSCGVCGGLNSCKQSCDHPSTNILNNETSSPGKDCWRLISLTPGIMDLADSLLGTVWLFAERPPPGVTSLGVNCTLKRGDTDIAKFSGDVTRTGGDEERIQLTFPLPPTLGDYNLSCTTTSRLAFAERLHVVDTARLQPLTIDKSTLVTWTQNEVRLKVGKMSALPGEVLCFGRSSDGRLLYRAWSSSLEGNGREATVLCPQLTLTQPGQLFLGLAHSYSAIEKAKVVQLTGVAVSPRPLYADYIHESSKVEIFFDQNLEEDSIKDCQSIFQNSSLAVFGEGAECDVTADRITVKMRETPSLNKTILQFTDNVKTKFSNLAVEGSVPLSFQHEKIQKSLRLEGPRKVCIGDVVEMRISGGEPGEAKSCTVKLVLHNPSLVLGKLSQSTAILPNCTANGTNPASASFMLNTANGFLEERLQYLEKCLECLVYHNKVSAISVDRYLKNWKRHEMTAGMQYMVEVESSTGDKLKTEVLTASPGEVWAEVEGPEVIDLGLGSPGLYLAGLRSCRGNQLLADKFLWGVTNEKGEAINISLVDGPTLQIDGRELKPSEKYTISVQVLKDGKVIGKDTLGFKTKLSVLQLNLPESEIVIGTGQPLEIDASTSTNVNPNILKFKWTCIKGYCFEPRKEKKLLENMKTFTQPVLKLPPGSLAIGKYEFEVEAVMDGGKARSSVSVSVVSGQPPYFSAPSLRGLGTDRDLNISLQVSQIIGRCELYWESIPIIGYSYIPINESGIILEGSPHFPLSRNHSLILKNSLLKPGAKYMIKSSADCGHLTRSHYQFRIFVPEKFPTFQLKCSNFKNLSLIPKKYCTSKLKVNRTTPEDHSVLTASTNLTPKNEAFETPNSATKPVQAPTSADEGPGILIYKSTKKATIVSTNPTTMLPKNTVTSTIIRNITSTTENSELRRKLSSTTPATPINVTKTHKGTTIFTEIPSNVTKTFLYTTLPNVEDERLEPIYHFKYVAYFRINESYSEKVGKKEREFCSHLENQLSSLANISLPVSVESEGEKLKIYLKIEESKFDNESRHLATFAEMLRNGTITFQGLHGEVLSVPKQDLHLMETEKSVSGSSAFITVIFVLLVILIGSLMMAVYIRTSREEGLHRLTDESEEPPAPKYLRLHDTVSLGSSGPSSPSFHEMESSLAIVSRTRRGYETVDNFRDIPGNI